MAKKNKIPKLLIVVWVINIIGIIGFGFFLWDNKPVRAQPVLATVEEAFSFSSAPSITPAPAHYLIPNVTPNPRGTFIAEVTPTQFDFEVELNKKPTMIIGYSVAGRPIEVFRFGQGADERLIIAGIHGGNEWNTIALADELIAYIDEHPDIIPSGVSLYILRALNPDGHARARGYEGRTNENGVDLNHNFPYRWKKEWKRDGCWNYLPTTGGTHPGSEPETIVLMNFVNAHDFSALISYHSAALGIFAGGLPPFAPSERLAQAMSDVSFYAYPPYNTGCEYSGNLTDWASSVKDIPAVDIELKNHRDTDFDDNLKILKVFLNWTR